VGGEPLIVTLENQDQVQQLCLQPVFVRLAGQQAQFFRGKRELLEFAQLLA
jgi:hypothetical protein